MTANVPMSEEGSTRALMSVVRRLRRKRKITATTSATANSSVLRTSWMDPSIKSARV